MATEGLSTAQLLTCSDADFDNNIKNMSIKGLMELITSLQREMATEQQKFNGLTSSLQGLKDRSSRQYKTINRDMMASQTRLTSLMNRSMKCFSQQSVQQSSQGAQLRRRNSAKSSENPSSPSKSSSVQRSRSLHATVQPSNTATDPSSSNSTTTQNSTNPTPRPSSAHVVLRGGVSRALGQLGNKGAAPPQQQQQQQQRPASVAGVNGVVANSNASSTPRVSVASAAGASSSSTTSLNIQPQPMVMGAELTTRSKSQILITPSTASSQPPPASASPSNPRQAFAGLPSVKQLAQTFGAKTGNAGGQASTNYRPVIRAQSMAASDLSRSADNIHSSSASSKVNGLPAPVLSGDRAQGLYVKRSAAPKPPATATTNTSSKSELEMVHARFRAARETNMLTLPNKPSAPVTENGDREVSVFTTNLDRKKSSSSIVLGSSRDFDSDSQSANNPGQNMQGPPLTGMRKAQSREELYAIESRARVQKDALLREIESKKPTLNGSVQKPPGSSSATAAGTSTLTQRLQQDEKGKKERTSAPPPPPPPQPTTTTATDAKNKAPKSRVYVQLQPAVPSSSGDGAGADGVAVTVRSSSQQDRQGGSRENLAEQSQDAPVSDNQPTSAPSSATAATVAAPSVSASLSASSAPVRSRSPVPVESRLASAGKNASDPMTSSGAAAGAVSDSGRAAAGAVADSGRAAVGAVADSVTAAVDQSEMQDDEENVPRMNLRAWDPKPVLDRLYTVKLMDETAEDISHQFISMEGLMEKLPMNKKKSTLLKTWKRRFFRAKDGWLQYYETGHRDKPSETLQLMGGHVDDMGNRILGIDDGRGHYLMVRAPTDKEYGQWKVALESQTADNTRATYIRPILHSPPHSTKKVVVIDMGSSAIRAGILGDQVSLPQVFFPSVVAVDKKTGAKVVGMEAYQPEVRHNSTLLHPIRPSNKVDLFNIDVDMMSAIFGKVFSELKVNPSHYHVMLSTPQTLSDSLRAGLMEALVGSLGVRGVCMVQQSLLALYSYRTSTGIIVDIGHRIEILPIYDGFVIESGVARCPYGSQKVVDSLKKALLETNYKFASEVELLLVRHIMEQCCYVAQNYKDEETLCHNRPGKLMRPVNLNKLNLPEGAYKCVEVEEGRFISPEGFFNVDLWEMDYPTLHKLIFQAIQSCPMDNRRHMYRAVYLSGGVTMLPGFVDRLHAELRKLAPPAVTVEVHASPQRYHAAYLGACSVASMPQFQDMAISADEWRREGARAFRKWQAPST